MPDMDFYMSGKIVAHRGISTMVGDCFFILFADITV